MHPKTLAALALALALLPLAPAAQGSHTGQYRFNPVEHDDQGRSDEPDFGATSVLGIPIGNRVIDANLDGVATPDTALPPGPGLTPVLAPGCTDDAGRQPSGSCGLWTVGGGTSNTGEVVPPGLVGIQGMTGSAAPGRFTPSKSVPVRFLDSLAHLMITGAGSVYVDLNHKLLDTGASAVLASLDPGLGTDLIGGPQGLWAFYGQWVDKNGNGVIDHLGGTVEGPAPTGNEFVWYGNCLIVGGAFNPQSLSNGYCALDDNPHGPSASMLSYVFPGNHHGLCLGLGPECPASPGDLPGKQVVFFLDSALGGPVFGIGIQNLDNFDDTVNGDPLFGPQGTVAPDGTFEDRTGEPDIGARHWVHGRGWATWFYDQSMVASTVIVAAVNCKPDGSARQFDLNTCTFLDVDNYPAWNPLAEELVQGAVKPTARSSWVTVRDAYLPMNGFLDGTLNSKALYDATLGAQQGAAGAQLFNPGQSREPNHPEDSYPGASYLLACPDGEARHNGWCNTYSGYAAQALAYTDVVPVRSVFFQRAVTVTGSACALCTGGPLLNLGFAGDTLAGQPLLRAPGDHRATLGPGQYYFQGFMGLWRDAPQVRTELTLDLSTLQGVTTTFVDPVDGWVGSIVNATGAFGYRGYGSDDCTTDQGPGPHTWAECHPYRDGNLVNPQQYGATNHGEWDAECANGAASSLVLEPDGGAWTVPVFVWVNHEQGIQQLLPQPSGVPFVNPGVMVDRTGTTGPIVMQVVCLGGLDQTVGIYYGSDYLILPAGNLDLGVTTRVSATLQPLGGTPAMVTDVDRYEPWGTPTL